MGCVGEKGELGLLDYGRSKLDDKKLEDNFFVSFVVGIFFRDSDAEWLNNRISITLKKKKG